ncbi:MULTISPECIES: type II restriction endonuclease [unclassified Lebetimonas]|uniref:type II restriction endonuclease n=1 Tax=unclassified Lebetimonas TaxID=2648158 RepID=UPI000465BB55|nr:MULTISPECIES: type II restriction endonuclease [unclassified Lebetimonas]
MKKLCQLLNKTEDELFEEITSSFKDKITQWDYFVNWKKVLQNIEPIEKELNLLNYLIGKKKLHKETVDLLLKYPETIKAIPLLLAIRDKSLEVLIDTRNFIYREFNFSKKSYSKDEIKIFSDFILKSGLGELLKDKKIKNLVDYATGVEVGLDSNGRKNRGGTLMENIVEEFVRDTTKELNIKYMPQATAKKIKDKWNIDVKVDKSSRIIDFAVNKNGKLYFIEVNFYGGGGSKLKSTATEYIRMNDYWNNQGIEFIWITDGAGWKSTLKPLREYFDKADYLLNLEMLRNGVLKRILE